MPLTQKQVDACAILSWKNVTDIDSFFASSGGFFDWYNTNLSGDPAFVHRGTIAITTDRLTRFKAFWDRIPDVFALPSISGLEFAALMSVSVQETSGNLWAAPEKVGTADHPGISYAFDAIPGLKASYNSNPGLGNATALTLFRDADYRAAHSALPGFAAVASGAIDPQWGGAQWPVAFGAAHFKKEDENLNGFVMQADFYKFRGHGVIQTTGREGYKALIGYILTSNAAAANPVLLSLRNTWSAFPVAAGADQQDVIASRSTNAQWDQAFGQSLVLATGVQLDSARKKNYLNIGRTAAIVNGNTTQQGSFFFMARKINAGNYPNIVAPMMSAMAAAIAAGAGVAAAVPAALTAAKMKPARKAVKKAATKAVKKAAKKAKTVKKKSP